MQTLHPLHKDHPGQSPLIVPPDGQHPLPYQGHLLPSPCLDTVNTCLDIISCQAKLFHQINTSDWLLFVFAEINIPAFTYHLILFLYNKKLFCTKIFSDQIFFTSQNSNLECGISSPACWLNFLSSLVVFCTFCGFLSYLYIICGQYQYAQLYYSLACT